MAALRTPALQEATFQLPNLVSQHCAERAFLPLRFSVPFVYSHSTRRASLQGPEREHLTGSMPFRIRL